MKKSFPAFALPAFAVALPVLFVAGCSSNTTPADTNSTTADNSAIQAPEGTVVPTPNTSEAPSTTAPQTGAPDASSTQSPGAKMPQVPPGMSMGNGAVLPASPALDKQIAALQNGDKKKLAQAYASRGSLRMNDPNAGPRVKYRAALEDYRLALKADPKNPEALANKKQIEDIYKMMGRPIPQ